MRHAMALHALAARMAHAGHRACRPAGQADWRGGRAAAGRWPSPRWPACRRSTAWHAAMAPCIGSVVRFEPADGHRPGERHLADDDGRDRAAYCRRVARYVGLVLTLSFLVGLMQVLLGLARVGRPGGRVPHSVVVGFTGGAAVPIIINQLPAALGIALPRAIGLAPAAGAGAAPGAATAAGAAGLGADGGHGAAGATAEPLGAGDAGWRCWWAR